MGSWASGRLWRVTCLPAVGVLAGVIMAGCGHKEPAQGKIEDPADGPAPAGEEMGTAALDPRLHQPFAEATVTDPPAEWQRPPDLTMTNKSVGKLYTEVVQNWDHIRFVSSQGKHLGYRAILETELGSIEITLRPDLAPNHVRSFVALARVGYYDGLVFERTIHEAIEGRPDDRVEIIEAGCPMGTGEAGYGSIGYWLKPEITAALTHEEGVVGASHGEDGDTSACKFYINLCKAPFLDGNYTVFGKVTKGMDVARKVLSLPVRNDSEYPEGDRPVQPVVIRKVTIQTEEMDNWVFR
jgi:peptidyl-prolyl cis-trans isomerase B (cyclophilin B)